MEQMAQFWTKLAQVVESLHTNTTKPTQLKMTNSQLKSRTTEQNLLLYNNSLLSILSEVTTCIKCPYATRLISSMKQEISPSNGSNSWKKRFQNNPHLREDYVQFMRKGARNVNEALQLYTKVSTILQQAQFKAQFKLRKWSSNKIAVLNKICHGTTANTNIVYVIRYNM
ncbi:hypothetical protein CBL_10768 [Carabus blaptoides fortunei]